MAIRVAYKRRVKTKKIHSIDYSLLNIDKLPYAPERSKRSVRREKSELHKFLDRFEPLDSCFFPLGRGAIGSSISYYEIRTGKEFTIRNSTENGINGVRIWRLK